jgi:hypothetical protein
MTSGHLNRTYSLGRPGELHLYLVQGFIVPYHRSVLEIVLHFFCFGRVGCKSDTLHVAGYLAFTCLLEYMSFGFDKLKDDAWSNCVYERPDGTCKQGGRG